MNSNEFIKKNWMGAILLIVVLTFIFFTFGRNKTQMQTIADANRSFIGADYGSTANAGVSDGSVMSPVTEPIVTQPATQQPATTTISAEPIRWCVLLDGVNHIPDFFGEGIDNKVGGTDWHSQGNDDPRGPHGVVTENGKKIFFVKKSYLDSHRASPSTFALKTNAAGWRELPMTWAKIAGEPALVYVK
ncbi:hypothetical protein JXK06_00785 [Patescibacteria group bacterium]|nr:hypothetical protein [Patescibacteria group bacterium]